MLFCLATPRLSQVHLPVHLPCYDLPPLCSIVLLRTHLSELGESDGRYVRASEPASEELSISLLLLNPPLGAGFTAPSVVTCYR